MAKAVFLDREGVVIRSDLVGSKPIAVHDIARMEIMLGVAFAGSTPGCSYLLLHGS